MPIFTDFLQKATGGAIVKEWRYQLATKQSQYFQQIVILVH